MTVKHLIKKPNNWKVEINNNMVWQSAYYIENQLISSGAKAGADYNILDVFKLGLDFCIVARLEEIVNKINTIGSTVHEDFDDCVDDSKDISDAEKAKPIKSSHIVGYQ
jgi:hypothetical protein